MLRIGAGGVLIGLALGGAGAAPTLYKCSAGGKVSYGDAPCASGQSVELEVPAAPAPPQGQGGALARQKKMLDQLEQERQKREAGDQRERDRAGRAAAAYRKQCATLELNRQWALEDAAAISDKHAARAKLKARRAAQRLALACPD